jgi:hypothetical protein
VATDEAVLLDSFDEEPVSLLAEEPLLEDSLLSELPLVACEEELLVAASALVASWFAALARAAAARFSAARLAAFAFAAAA